MMPRTGLILLWLALTVGVCRAQTSGGPDPDASGVGAVAAVHPPNIDASSDRAPVRTWRFVRHFLRAEASPGDTTALWYLHPEEDAFFLDAELGDLLDAEARLRNLIRYRDDAVLLEMNPLSPGWRVVLPFNRHGGR